MKRLISFSLLLVLAACQSQPDVRSQQTVAHNPALASIQGSNLIATGDLNSYGGTIQTSGYVQIAAIDGQNMLPRESLVERATNEVIGAVGANRMSFPAVPLYPGTRVIDVIITLSEYRVNHRMSLQVEAGRRYVVRGQNQGQKGQIWIEDDRGYRTTPIGVMAR